MDGVDDAPLPHHPTMLLHRPIRQQRSCPRHDSIPTPFSVRHRQRRRDGRPHAPCQQQQQQPEWQWRRQWAAQQRNWQQELMEQQRVWLPQ
jgi:hypothetical protein